MAEQLHALWTKLSSLYTKQYVPLTQVSPKPQAPKPNAPPSRCSPTAVVGRRDFLDTRRPSRGVALPSRRRSARGTERRRGTNYRLKSRGKRPDFVALKAEIEGKTARFRRILRMVCGQRRRWAPRADRAGGAAAVLVPLGRNGDHRGAGLPPARTRRPGLAPHTRQHRPPLPQRRGLSAPGVDLL